MFAKKFSEITDIFDIFIKTVHALFYSKFFKNETYCNPVLHLTIYYIWEKLLNNVALSNGLTQWKTEAFFCV